MAGTATRMVKIRLTASDEDVQDIAARIAEDLEGEGYELIEWTASYPCRPPDEDKSRVYLTALPKAQ
jgi:hypothetical protein